MTDGETLLLVLGVLYLSDCLVWVGRRSVLFSAPWCRSWRASLAPPHFGNANGGITCLNPLPPLGVACFGRFPPVSFSPIGMCAFTLHVADGPARLQQSANVLRYDAIAETSTQGRQLFVNGSRFVKCDTAGQAERLVQLIERIKNQPDEAREQLVRGFIASGFNREMAQQQLDRCIALARRMRWSCSLFFLLLYVAVPIVATVYGLAWLIMPVAAVMLVGAGLISLQYFCAHKALYPANKGDRVSHVAKMVMCPPAAIRSQDLLTLECMAEFHPVLLAHLFLDKSARKTVGTIIRELKYPIWDGLTDAEAVAIVSWHAAAESDACSEFLRVACAEGVEDILSPPQWDGTSSVYCPRCSCQLTTSAAECPDCTGIGLRAFSVTQTSETTHE